MKMRKRSLIALVAAGCVVASMGAPATARKRHSSAPLEGEGVGLKIVANIEYAGGTDMEFLTQNGRDYALAASAPGVGGAEKGDLHVIDITNPEKPVLAAKLGCSLYQADVQISHDQKTALLAADSAGGPDGCLALGKVGFLTIDISNVLKPKAIGFAETNKGSHNVTAHPKKPYVYNSNSELTAGPGTSEIQVWSIKNPAKPKLVTTINSLPHAPHDVSFNKKGDMAVTAAISSIGLYDTSDPAAPTLVSITQCPGCSITHDAKFTPDGTHVIVGDEGGGGGGYPCPGGALYFYQLQVTPAAPVLVLQGLYEPQEVILARDGQTGPQACTSHVFDISDDGTKVAISWYSAGTRYLDVSSMVGATFGPQGTPTGVKELGWFMPEGGVTWSSKFYKGPYIYSNDEFRGFDVFKIEK
ncbi:MAG TPA: hypothetical protein VNC78_07285 [Actinomycetota bacterium]|nr:hypothetical protein [Actinomycetota bacterium]